MKRMTRHCGIDTTVLMRLATGWPRSGMIPFVARLVELARDEDCLLFASNLVIAECYLELQRSYGVPKNEAREGLYRVLTSGVVHPMGGHDVLGILANEGPAAPLLDRLAAEEYGGAGLRMLTLDRRLGCLDTVHCLTYDEFRRAHQRVRRLIREPRTSVR